MEEENSKYIILPEYITKDKNLTDKEKSIYSMILTLSKNQECIMSNAYISSMLSITKVHASRLISSLRDKGYINVKIICIIVQLWSSSIEGSILMEDFRNRLEYFLKRLEQLENLPDDNPIKRNGNLEKSVTTLRFIFLS